MKSPFFSSNLSVCILLLFCALCFPTAATAHGRFPISSDLVEIEIIGDDSGRLPLYAPPYGELRENSGIANYSRVYVPARRGERFSIEIRNRSHYSVGLVVSVDGRNIITGERSYLRSREGMYVVGAHQSGRYTGWRSSLREVQRFYFTDAPDSYAGAWGDYQQMGMIAVAAFRERYSDRFHHIPANVTPSLAFRGYTPHPEDMNYGDREKPSSSRSEAPGAGKSSEPMYDKRLSIRDTSEAGTGYGETRYSPVREVSFEPESFPFQRLTIRYDWAENLRDRGVIPGWKHPRYEEDSRPHRPFAPHPPR